MARSHPQMVSFNAGEWSRLMYGRADLSKHGNAQRRCENFIPTVQGPAKRRGGTRMVQQQQDPAERTWLRRFVYSASQAYVLEFAPFALRFYTVRASLVLDVEDTPLYQLATPYTASDLTRADGTFGLDLEQAGDVVYIACAGQAPRKLSRFGPLTWTLEEHLTRSGPLQDVNTNTALRMGVSARDEAIVVNATVPVFIPDMVGMLLRIDLEVIDIPPWEPGKAVYQGGRRRSDGKTYVALSGDGTTLTGSSTPIHESGAVFDGSGVNSDDVPVGINWLYEDPGYGIGRITAFVSPTQVSLQVHNDQLFPADLIGEGKSNRWQLGAFGKAATFPTHVKRWKNRLVYLGGRGIWASSPAAFDDFPRDIQGEVRADAGLTLTLDSTDLITWAHVSEVLLVGTGSGEYIVRKQTETDPLGPGNVESIPKSGFGARPVAPTEVGTGIVMVNKSGRRVRLVSYDVDTFVYQARDITVAAEHITKSGIIDWAFQQQPDRVLWAVRADGTLIGATIEDDQDVLAWHPHPMQGFVESVAVIPSPDGSREDVWLKVRRVIAGTTKRFTEYIEEGHELGDVLEEAFFVDCGLTYRGAPATTISGLTHLAGATVSALADGGAMPNQVVSEQGTIVLGKPGALVHVGLPIRAVIEPIAIPRASNLGTAQGKLGRVPNAQLLLIESAGGKIGPIDQESKLRPLAGRGAQVPGGEAPALISDYIDINLEGGYGRNPSVVFVQDQPLPMILAGIFPEAETNERS